MSDTNQRRKRLKEIALVFLKLGTIAFGGPAAHIAMMDDEIVTKRKWVDRVTFLDLIGASNLIPGPNSTELAIHLGYKRAGWSGLVTAGICFILPAMVIVWILAAVYSYFSKMPELSFLLYGIKPVIIAIVLQALWNLGRTTAKSALTTVVGFVTTILFLLGWNELVLLLLSGLIVMSYQNRTKLYKKRGSLSVVFPIPWILASSSIPRGDDAQTAAIGLSTMFIAFLKIGAVLYGSGYVLLAFLQSTFVDHFGVLTSQQLLDAVAVGQITPGPVFTTATFIGYLIGGNGGAVLATIAIFLPAFVFVALISPWSHKLRRSPWISGLLDGVNAASWGLMAAVAWQLSRSAIPDVPTFLIAAISLFIILRYRQVNSVWLVIGGGIIGTVIKLL